jgi:hypothetical protein
MPSNAVPGFAPSRHGFHFANRWPSTPARWWSLGLLHFGIGDAGRGLCGGMAFGVRDRWERGELTPPDTGAPPAGTPLFREIVDRQFDSFDRLVLVPLRFWRMAAQSARDRGRASVTKAWPVIRSEVDAGRLAMVGLVRSPSVNPLHLQLGHQVAAYAYTETAERLALRVYDPNHPDDDAVEVRVDRGTDGSIALSQSTGEAVEGILALPFRAPR